MLSMPAMKISTAPRVVAAVAVLTAIGPVLSQEITAGPFPSPSTSRDELRKHVPDFEQHAAQATEAERQVFVQELRSRLTSLGSKTESVAARSASGSVSATARCRDGYVQEGRHNIPDGGVTTVSEELRDCDQSGCRAYEVNATREGEAAFDLDVSVVCSS